MDSHVPGAAPRVALCSTAVGYGGAEAVLVSLAAAWTRRFTPVAVLGSAAPPELLAALQAVGMAVHQVEGLARHPARGTAARLQRVLAEAAPDVVLVNLSDQGDGRALLRGVARYDAPALALLHLWIPGRARWRDQVSAHLLRPLQAVTVPSRGAADLARQRGVRAVPVPVAPARPSFTGRSAARARLGLAPEEFVVGGIGRLHPQKGWDVLVSAAQLLHNTRPDIQVMVVGDGPDRDALAALPGAGHVRFAGAVPQAAELLPAFDVLVMPSRFEGLPLSAMEAAWAGVPVVGSDVVGVRDAVSDFGVLVPPGDPQALATALLALADDPERRAALAARGQAVAADRFTIERMHRALGDIVQSLVPAAASS